MKGYRIECRKCGYGVFMCTCEHYDRLFTARKACGNRHTPSMHYTTTWPAYWKESAIRDNVRHCFSSREVMEDLAFELLIDHIDDIRVLEVVVSPTEPDAFYEEDETQTVYNAERAHVVDITHEYADPAPLAYRPGLAQV